MKMNNLITVPTAFIIILSFTLFALPHTLSADSRKDSLFNLIRTQTNQDKKALNYFKLIERLQEVDDPEAAVLLQDFSEWSLSNNTAAEKVLLLQGHSYELKEDHKTALEYYEKAKKSAIDNENQVFKLYAINAITKSYTAFGDVKSIDSIYNEAVQIVTDIDSHLPLANKALSVFYRHKTHYMYRQGKEEDVLICLDSTLHYAIKSGDYFLRIKTLLRNSAYTARTEPDTALQMLTTAKELSEDNGVSHLFPGIPKSMSEIYIYKGETEKALKYAFEAVDLSEKSGKTMQKVKAYYTLGTLYQSLNDYEKTEEYLQKAIDFAKTAEDKYYQAVSLGTIGKNYLFKGEYNTAVPYFVEAIEYCENPYILIQLKGDLALSYIGLDSLASAKELILQNETSPYLGTGYSKFFNDAVSAYWHMVSKNYKKAIRLAEDTYAHALETDNMPMQMQVTDILHKSYSAIGQNSKAYKSAMDYFTLSDSLSQDNQLKKITTLELTTNFEKEKALLAAQKEKDEAILKAETRQSQIIAAGVGLFALLSLGFFVNARRNNKIIASQNEQLNHLNQTKDRIFTILGHDMRKPVLSFRGIAEKVNYLLQNEDYERLGRLGNQIEENALGLSKLTDNLLTWALTQRDVMPYNPTKIRLFDIAEETRS